MNDETLEALQIANGLAEAPVVDRIITPRELGRYEGVACSVDALSAAGFQEASAWLKSRGCGQAAVKEHFRMLDKVLPLGLAVK